MVLKFTKSKYTRDPELERLYHSKEWKQLRNEVLLEHRGICSNCGQLIRGRYIVHHTTPATPDNFFNKEILTLLCLECHNTVTFSEHVKRQVPQAGLLSGLDKPDFIPPSL